MRIIQVTDKAQEKLLPLLKDGANKVLRIVLEGFGWGGPRLGVALDEPKDDDSVFTANNLEFHVEKRIELFADNTVVDYVHSWFSEGFVVKPAYGGSC